MDLQEIKKANEYLGTEFVNEVYMKNAPKNIKKYFGIPIKENGNNSSIRKT